MLRVKLAVAELMNKASRSVVYILKSYSKYSKELVSLNECVKPNLFRKPAERIACILKHI